MIGILKRVQLAINLAKGLNAQKEEGGYFGRVQKGFGRPHRLNS